MKTFFLVALLVLFKINLSYATTTGRSCREVVYMKPHPIDCCTYPTFHEHEDLRSKCDKECKKNHDSNDYCARVCELTDYEIYIDGKIKLDNIKNLFVNGKSQNGEEVKQTKGQLDDTWTKILEESIKTCATDKEIKNDDEIPSSKISGLVLELLNCIRRHNFVACPDFNSSKECSELKDAVATCNKNSENFLFGVFHEQRKQDQAQGGQMAISGRSKSGR
ncbi:hypothetical protein PVAND_014404 [Polypedilum vanderplanki]|uniref:OBP47-like domain-containing protein n=1 Tax=Polypedilum vanderplanki TaxID=319348 RepID=A0A9J6B9K1_POLVA|nr:hypothetical protein PVAND_014404 [Polypedilum vanderplanki]